MTAVPAVRKSSPAEEPGQELPEPCHDLGRVAPRPGPAASPGRLSPVLRRRLRRLAPQAVALVLLAGGALAYAAQDKQIRLTVDGEPRVLHTFARDVSVLLSREKISVGPHDLVAPAPTTALSSGDEVAVRYGRPVDLTVDGRRRRVWTTARRVDEALRQLGVRAEGAHLTASRSTPIGRAGLPLAVRSARTLKVVADGRTHTVRTTAATTTDALAEAGIPVDRQDRLSVPAESFPQDRQAVVVQRVREKTRTRDVRIAHKTRHRHDSSLLRGTRRVVDPGRDGLRRVTYRERTVDGKKEKPRRLGVKLVRPARDRIVRIGTRVPRPPAPLAPTVAPPARTTAPAPAPTPTRPRTTTRPPSGGGGRNWAALAQCESGGNPAAIDPSGTYGGLYQFDQRTWNSVGGSGRPQDASAGEQTYRAQLLYARRGGPGAWPVCGARL